MKDISRQSGLTLIELLIASTLGLILLVGVVQLFVSGSDTFRMAEAIGRMQESGRLAQDVLGRSIRNADYWGCRNAGDVAGSLDTVLDSGNADYDADRHDFGSFQALEFGVAPAGGNRVAGSATLIVRGATSLGIHLDASMGAQADALDVNSTAGVNLNDILMLTDCEDSVAFQATGITGGDTIAHAAGKASGTGTGTRDTPGNSVAELPKSYASGEIFRLYATSYFLEENPTTGIRSLMMRTISNASAQEVVSDIHDMQMQVGLGDSGDNVINNWLDVNTTNLPAIDSGFVKAVRISLLVRSPNDRVASQRQAVCFPAWTDCSNSANLWQPAADDRHYYRVYTSMYSVRNRLLNTGT